MTWRLPRAVIFDYGNTLVSVDPALHSARTDYADVVAVPGAERMTRHLETRGRLARDKGIAFIDRFLSIREANRKRADETGDEIPAAISLSQTFHDLGLAELEAAEVQEILRVFFSVEEEQLQEIPGAGRMLERLAGKGTPMALLSNATDGATIARGIERHGWTRHFRPLVVSSDIGVRKPRAEAFQSVLRTWTFAPEEIAMVGDSLRHDVGGGQALGLRTIHFTWIPNPQDPLYLGRIVPDQSAKTHEDLERLLVG
jgi:HAD superfamily hydrolase (TIGR01549 family)